MDSPIFLDLIGTDIQNTLFIVHIIMYYYIVHIFITAFSVKQNVQIF